jgi:hypothetical protein
MAGRDANRSSELWAMAVRHQVGVLRRRAKQPRLRRLERLSSMNSAMVWVVCGFWATCSFSAT